MRIENRPLQFVIQEHSRRDEPVHWDLMLEVEGVLRTYRLNLPPEELGDGTCTATQINDHPVRFLTYQGSVNKGLGSVRLVDTGRYCVIQESKELCLFDFNGEILKGQFRLARTDGDSWDFGCSRNDTRGQD